MDKILKYEGFLYNSVKMAVITMFFRQLRLETDKLYKVIKTLTNTFSIETFYFSELIIPFCLPIQHVEIYCHFYICVLILTKLTPAPQQ